MNMPKLFELVKKGDKAARDKLVEDNMRLVYSIAKRYLGLGYEMEDLSQIGCIGLIKAIDKFDVSYNVQFSTYAVPVIAGEIKRFLRDDGPIKMSRSIKDNLLKIKRAREKLSYCKEREATIEEIMEETNLSEEEVILSMGADVEIESINGTVYDNGDSNITLGDRIPNKVDYIQRSIDNIYVEELLGKLDEKERRIIELRYFEEKKQAEVGKELGISQVQVSRIEKKILLRLKNQSL